MPIYEVRQIKVWLSTHLKCFVLRNLLLLIHKPLKKAINLCYHKEGVLMGTAEKEMKTNHLSRLPKPIRFQIPFGLEKQLFFRFS